MKSPFYATLIVVSCLLPTTAQAYIDPGTGSYVVQAVVAAAMGGMVAIKMYWQRIKGFLSRAGSSTNAGDAAGPGASSDSAPRSNADGK